MKASVKLTIDRIAISNRVRVGESSLRAQPTCLIPLFTIKKGKSLKPIFMVAIAGATEEVAFSPFFGPAGRFLKK